MKRFTAILDPNGNPMNGINVSDHVDAMVLGAASAEVYTLRQVQKSFELTGTTPFYVKFGGARQSLVLKSQMARPAFLF